MRMKQCEIWRKPGIGCTYASYKQMIRQCEILLANTGSIQTLKTFPPSLASFVKSTVGPTPCTGQVHSQGIDWRDRLALNSQTRCYLSRCTGSSVTNKSAVSLNIMYTLGLISLMDSDKASVTCTQGGFFTTTTKKKQVGNIKLVPRSVSSNTQEL